MQVGRHFPVFDMGIVHLEVHSSAKKRNFRLVMIYLRSELAAYCTACIKHFSLTLEASFTSQ